LILVALPLGGVLWRGLSVSALTDAIERAGGSAIRSIAYAGIASCIACALAFFVAYNVHRRALAGWWWLDALTLALFSLPGAIIAIGLIELWNRPSLNAIYASPALLIMGFVAQYCALGNRAIAADRANDRGIS